MTLIRLAAALSILCTMAAGQEAPIRLHPENSRYFQGRATVLVASDQWAEQNEFTVYETMGRTSYVWGCLAAR
jgi:hypothetical protein